MTTWHPISTAPRDGTCPYCGVEILPDDDRGGAIECCPEMASDWWSGATDRAHNEGMER